MCRYLSGISFNPFNLSTGTRFKGYVSLAFPDVTQKCYPSPQTRPDVLNVKDQHLNAFQHLQLHGLPRVLDIEGASAKQGLSLCTNGAASTSNKEVGRIISSMFSSGWLGSLRACP